MELRRFEMDGISDGKSGFVRHGDSFVGNLLKAERAVQGYAHVPPEMAWHIVDEEASLLASLRRDLDGMASHAPLPSAAYAKRPDAEPIVEIERDGPIYHFRFAGLLPRRNVLPGVARGGSRSRFDADWLHASYAASVRAFADRHGIEPFRSKCLVLFVSCYGGGVMLDHDNLEPKPFIDACVSGVLVPDDSPDWVDVMFASSPGTERHTDVYVGLPEDVLPYYLR